MPPKITVRPRSRNSLATSKARGSWQVSITEIATRSAAASKSIGSRFSSVKATSTSGGRAAAKTTGPWGGRWNSVWRSSLGQLG